MDTPSSVTLTPPVTPPLKAQPDSLHIFRNPAFSASSTIEYISTRPKNSSAIYVYDVAQQAGFGVLSTQWFASSNASVPTLSCQTRAGAGLSIVGRLAAGTSHDSSARLTAYTTTSGLSAMAPALAHLPPATKNSRLTIQVPSISPVGESFSLAPSLAPLSTVLPLLPANFAILLSATPQQIVDFTEISYRLDNLHVAHIFDQYSAAREIGDPLFPPASKLALGHSLPEALSTLGYDWFTYTGATDPHSVFVILNGPLALVAQALIRRLPGVGVLVVNVLRPWDDAAFQSAVPSSAKSIYVIDEVPNLSSLGVLFPDVLGSLIPSASSHSVRPLRITPTLSLEYIRDANKFSSFLQEHVPTVASASVPADNITSKKVLFLADPNSPLALVSGLAQTMFIDSPVSSRLLVSHDVFSKPGGVSMSQLLLSHPKEHLDFQPMPTSIPTHAGAQGATNLLVILDQTLLKTHSVLDFAAEGASVLVITSWTVEEVALALPSAAVRTIINRSLHLYAFNVYDILSSVQSPAGQETMQVLLVHLAFLRMFWGHRTTEEQAVRWSQKWLSSSLDEIFLSKINSYVWDALKPIHRYPPPDGEPHNTLRSLDFNAIAVEGDDGETIVNGARLGSWHDAAKHLLFPSVYSPHSLSVSKDVQHPSNPSLHPEILDKTFLVTCTVNRRLTPLDYDRNVFHLEFDTQGTGLKYEIGEALGVHGWNDETEVLEFCEWYGANPNKVLTIPLPGTTDEKHTRTVFQALQQQIDLFGRPPKSFYTELAQYASRSVDRYALLFIGSAEGASTFNKLSERDTVTFADVLRMYPSAHPPIEVLCSLIGDIAPRHYSIASAQSVVGDRVDLLVVMVDWLNADGHVRYGQCTRYLAGLRPGQKVTVSIKPSVMKLPPNDMQPLILAGLGTGAAPFRAFLQHRAHLAAQGKPIGPIYYYFGSRHQSQEYLYGEEIEAFILDGVITRAGLAFSRDGPKKVYIQNKMQEDAVDLVTMLQDQGVFYLCGPTWPVPDVYEALVGALVNNMGMTRDSAGEYLEQLKEEERYVLEVY